MVAATGDVHSRQTDILRGVKVDVRRGLVSDRAAGAVGRIGLAITASTGDSQTAQGACGIEDDASVGTGVGGVNALEGHASGADGRASDVQCDTACRDDGVRASAYNRSASAIEKHPRPPGVRDIDIGESECPHIAIIGDSVSADRSIAALDVSHRIPRSQRDAGPRRVVEFGLGPRTGSLDRVRTYRYCRILMSE